MRKLRSLCDGDVCQHTTLDEDAALLVEHCTQEVVGVNGTFHQYLGTSLVYFPHSFTGSVVIVFSVNDYHVFGIIGEKALSHCLFTCHSDKDKVGDFHIFCLSV